MPGKYQPDKANIFSKNIYFSPQFHQDLKKNKKVILL